MQSAFLLMSEILSPLRWEGRTQIMSYEALAMVDIAELTRPKARGEMVDTRVVYAPAEPKPDYQRMREAVHGKDATEGGYARDDKRKRA
jgi:hypothetical protein